MRLLTRCLLTMALILSCLSGQAQTTARPQTTPTAQTPATKKAVPVTPLVLSDVNGESVRPLENLAGKDKAATVFIFIAHDCPVANTYAPEINRLSAEYAPRLVAFNVVYVEYDLPAAEAKRHARSHQFVCRALRDPKHQLVKRLKARVTPEAVVVGPDGRTRYQGRIDNRVQELGRASHEASVFDLRNALDAILAGRAVPQPRTKTIGCYIPDAP